MGLFDEIDVAGSAQALPKNLQSALAAMPYVDPFFSVFLSGLKLTQTDSCPVMATNCVDEIFYNPQTLNENPDKWTPETLIGVLVHECMHILRLDGEIMRDAKTKHDLMNIAMDGIINRDLLACGYKFPTLRMSDPIEATKDPKKNNGQGYASKDAQATTFSIYNDLLELAKKKGAPKPHPHPLAGDIDMQAYKNARKAAGGGKGVSEKIEDAARAAATVAQGMAKQLGLPESAIAKKFNDMQEPQEENTSGDGWGLSSSAAARALEKLGIKVRTPRVKLLRVAGAQVRGMLRSNVKRQRSMLATNPMSAAWGRLLPGRRRAKDYRIAIAIDASGSITNDQLTLFTAAAHQWAQMFVGRGREIQVCYWSDDICDAGPMSKFVDIDRIPNAGGGTEFACVVSWLDALPDRPTHLLCFTDLQFPYPDSLAGNTQTIWIAPPKDMWREPPFGTKVELDA